MKASQGMILSLCLLIAGAARLEAGLVAKMSVNGQTVSAVDPGVPAVWEFMVVDDETNLPVKDFVAGHGKYMHLVVFSQDLSQFAHFHPFFDPGTGRFQTTVHLPVGNPDDQLATRALPKPGAYFVFIEVQSRSLGMRTFRFDLRANGEVQDEELVASSIDQERRILVYLDSEGEVAQRGAKYLAAMEIHSAAGEGGENLRFFVTMLRRSGNEYIEVDEIQPWLMMGGHAILTDPHGEGVSDKLFGHLHSRAPESGGGLRFSYFNRGLMVDGLNRLWVQTRLDDRLLTIPFTFEYP